MANPLAATDQHVATWFHAHLTHLWVALLSALTELGSGEWIGLVLFSIILFLLWKRSWPAIALLIVAVPGGMLLNEWLKIAVHRHRPFFLDPFGDWSGYSFASGHSIGATLLYGQIALFLVPMLKRRHWRTVTLALAALLISLVGFSRIALGAHYLSDVLGGIFLGLVWLVFCLIAGRPLHRRIRQSPGSTLELAMETACPSQ
jgi:membrane-associated phospholipid phosphatase